MTGGLIRCDWRGLAGDPLYEAYHDEEWGVPERNPAALWEKLVLDGFQAGLAWITILRKRDAFRSAFAGFDPERVARFGEADRARLLEDAGIVRSAAKIDAAISSARIFLNMRESVVDFADFLWGFTDGRPLQTWREGLADVPAETPLSRQVSAALKARGFRFAGPVIVYAFMQAVGMVNDHLVTCHRHAEVLEMGR